MANSQRYAKSKQCAAGIPILSLPATQYAAVRSSVAPCNHPFSFSFSFSSSQSQNRPEIQEIAQKLELRRHLNVEVVDDTALIDTLFISKINPNPKPQQIKNNNKITIKPSTKPAKRNRPRKEYRKIKKEKAAAQPPQAYSRAEMVSLASQNVDDQRTKWLEVYGSLAATVAAEYDGLVAAAAGGGGGPRAFGFYRRPFMENKPLNIDGAAMGKGSPLKISVH